MPNRLRNVGSNVLVADLGVDAMYIERDGRPPALVLRPGPSQGASVRAVQKVAPRSPVDDVQRLVRRYLPDAVDLTQFLRLDPVPAVPAPGDYSRFVVPRFAVALVITVLALLGGGFISLHWNVYNHPVTAVQVKDEPFTDGPRLGTPVQQNGWYVLGHVATSH